MLAELLGNPDPPPPLEKLVGGTYVEHGGVLDRQAGGVKKTQERSRAREREREREKERDRQDELRKQRKDEKEKQLWQKKEEERLRQTTAYEVEAIIDKRNISRFGPRGKKHKGADYKVVWKENFPGEYGPDRVQWVRDIDLSSSDMLEEFEKGREEELEREREREREREKERKRGRERRK